MIIFIYLFYYCVEVAHDSELFSSNKLLCNRNRAQQLLLSLSDKSEYQSVKFLDLILTAGWIGECTQTLAIRECQECHVMWKLREVVGHESLRVAYIAFFQSYISYELLILGLSAAVNNMLLTQNQVLRTIYRAFPLVHCNPLFLKMKVLNF